MTSDQDALSRAYRERNELAAALAHKFQSSVGFDREAPGWPVLYIQLPTGQVSYHFSPADTDLLCGQFIAADDSVWDGHTPEDRSERIMRYLRGEGR